MDSTSLELELPKASAVSGAVAAGQAAETGDDGRPPLDCSHGAHPSATLATGANANAEHALPTMSPSSSGLTMSPWQNGETPPFYMA